MPKCKCGRNMKWGGACDDGRGTRVYFCPKCQKPSKECDCPESLAKRILRETQVK